jgi:transglutaminase-like putative cysteine protease
MYSGHLGNGAKVNEDMEHHYTIDITDVPPTPDEEWAPPLDTIYWHIDFYYTYAFNTNEYWQKEGTVWRKEVERFVKPDKGLREAVGSLVGASDTEEQKAQKLYAAVMKLENTDYTRHKTEAERKAAKQKDIRSAEDVWKQKSGTSDELALLYVSMLSAAGIKAWPMMITDRSRAIFDTNYYSMSQLHDFIAIANISGKDVYLDPGEKFCDYGELGWRHLFTAGFRVSADYKSATLAGTPPGNSYTKAVVQRVADITLDESGNIKGFAQYIMTGPDALKWRHLNLSEGSDEVKKQFNELLHNELPDGVRGELDHFIGIEDSGVNLVAFVNLSGSMGTATGKRTFLPGVFFESRTTNLFVSEAKRLTPVDMHFARMTQDSVNYHLPAGYTVESAPNSNDASWPNSALMRIKSKANGNELNVARVFARNFIFVKDTDYQQLHDFYMKMAAADQQQIVLTRAASAPKGN